MGSVVLGAFVLGIVSGLRAFLAPAVLLLARGGVAGYVVAIASLGELVMDMLPQTPPRTFPPALALRVLSGAFVGWMLCTYLGAPAFAGAVAGIVGSLIGTYGGKAVRLALIERAGAVPAALIEDVVAILLAVCVVFVISPVPR